MPPCPRSPFTYVFKTHLFLVLGGGPGRRLQKLQQGCSFSGTDGSWVCVDATLIPHSKSYPNCPPQKDDVAKTRFREDGQRGSTWQSPSRGTSFISLNHTERI